MFDTLCFLLFVSIAFSTYGVDVSTRIYQSDWECLKNDGFDFAIIRAYQSTGHVDPNAKATVADALSGGMAHVDIYMFPCPSCGNAAGQVDDLLSAMENTHYGMVWLDIEGAQYWLGDYDRNFEFYKQLVQRLQYHGASFGTYSSPYEWSSVMGSNNGYEACGHCQFWWADYGSPTFSNYHPVGGWPRPAMRQYQGTSSRCGVSVDLDWYP